VPLCERYERRIAGCRPACDETRKYMLEFTRSEQAKALFSLV
jgi:hypothetical protein